MWNDGGEKHPLTFEEFRDCFLAFVLGLFCLNLYFHLKLYVYVSKRGFVHVSSTWCTNGGEPFHLGAGNPALVLSILEQSVFLGCHISASSVWFSSEIGSLSQSGLDLTM